MAFAWPVPLLFFNGVDNWYVNVFIITADGTTLKGSWIYWVGRGRSSGLCSPSQLWASWDLHTAHIVGGPALRSNLKMSSVGCSQGSISTKTSKLYSQKWYIPDFIWGLLNSFLGRDYKIFSVLQTCMSPFVIKSLFWVTNTSLSLHFNADSPPKK